jgi:hypothetical protein
MPRRRRSALPALLWLAGPGTCLGQGLFLEGGLSFARGDYIYTQPTSSGGAAAGLAWSARRLTFRATMPYFVRDTRVLPLSGEAPPGGGDTEPAATGHEGSVSDPVVQAYAQVLQSGHSGIGLSASVKVPLVEAGAYGTGEWDVGGGLSLSRLVGSATMLGLDVSYWHMGDMPDLPLQDGVAGTFTLGRSFGRSWLASASLSGSRSTVAGYEAPWWASLLVSRAGARGILGLTASVGLTDTAPDVTVGVVWRVRLDSPTASSRRTTARARPAAPGSSPSSRHARPRSGRSPGSG